MVLVFNTEIIELSELFILVDSKLFQIIILHI